MSVLVDRALEAAGLSAMAAARRGDGEEAGDAGDPGDPAVRADQETRLRGVDLLALGALADRVRRAEVGDEVRIYAPPPPEDCPDVVVLPTEGAALTGLELLREVAIARVLGPPGARVRVDWSRSGMEIAQVALGFGANELSGYIVRKDGLRLADGELLGVGKKSRQRLATAVKREELAGYVRRAGRVAVFAGGDAGQGDQESG